MTESQSNPDGLRLPGSSLDEAVAAVRRQIPASWFGACDTDGTSDSSIDRSRAITAIVLGSGLGGLADKIEAPTCIPFSAVPGVPSSTASGHRGQMIFGFLDDHPVVAMAGRLHRYEGWSNTQVAFPVRVMLALGANRLVLSNAAGGVHPKLHVGDIVVIRDHIDWLHQRSPVPGRPSVQPDRGNSLYDPDLASLALSTARETGFTAVEGTYLATLGPTYETRAEYRMMRRIGADVVGMSTVPEVLAAYQMGVAVLALSIVSNVANPDRANVADHSEVLQAGDAAAGKLEQIVRRVLPR